MKIYTKQNAQCFCVKTDVIVDVLNGSLLSYALINCRHIMRLVIHRICSDKIQSLSIDRFKQPPGDTWTLDKIPIIFNIYCIKLLILRRASTGRKVHLT